MFRRGSAGPGVGGLLFDPRSPLGAWRTFATRPTNRSRRTAGVRPPLRRIRPPARSCLGAWRSCGEDTQAASQADSHGASSILARELAAPRASFPRAWHLGSILDQKLIGGHWRNHSPTVWRTSRWLPRQWLTYDRRDDSTHARPLDARRRERPCCLRASSSRRSLHSSGSAGSWLSTGYPRVGSNGVHIAHMLWGGLLMLLALMLLIAFLDRSVQHLAAVIAGLGSARSSTRSGSSSPRTTTTSTDPRSP